MLGFASVADAVGTSMSALYGDAGGARALRRARCGSEGRLEHHRGRLRRRDGGVIDVIETVVGEFDATRHADRAARLPARRHRQRRGRAGAARARAAVPRRLLRRRRRDADSRRSPRDPRSQPGGVRAVRRRPPMRSAASRSTNCSSATSEQLIAAWRELIALGEAKARASRALGAAGPAAAGRVQLSRARAGRAAPVHRPRHHRSAAASKSG